MDRGLRLKTLCFFGLIVASSFSADATEIHLRSQCFCGDALVLLGDVADVRDENVDQAAALASIRLFPAPAGVRVVPLHEIQNLLALHSVDLSACRFSGASTVKIVRDDTRARRRATRGPLAQAVAEQATRRVASTILNYLQQKHPADRPRKVDLALDQRYIRLVAAEDAELAVQGGTPPWRGRQQFRLTVTTPFGSQRIPVTAVVSEPPLVVVAVRPLRRGERIRPDHVRLQPAPASAHIGDLVYRLQDVVGQQATRPINPGQPIAKGYLRPPLLVRRGQLVTVFAVASGVRVRTSATALQDGAQGDLVTVQSLDRRQKYTARVTGFQTVEVYADAARVDR